MNSPLPRAVSELVVPPTVEPITLDDAKLRAGLDWVAGDPRDALMQSFIAAARQQVEADTGLALLTQTRDVFYDQSPTFLPAQCRPLQEVVELVAIDSRGERRIDPGLHLLLPVLNRPLSVIPLARPRVDYDGTPGAYRLRVIVGWKTPADLPPLLTQAVGLLTAHYATNGRDLTTVGLNIVATPLGYAEAVAPFQQVTLA